MNTCRKTELFIVLSLASLLAVLHIPCALFAQKAGEAKYRVLVVQSYNPEYVWTQHINDGIKEALHGLDVSFEYLYMDAKRKPAPQALQQMALNILHNIDTSNPQVVVAVDDAAQVYLVEPYLKGRTHPQVVFCGVNAPISMYGFPVSNVSGVRERWHWRDGFKLLKTIIPKLQTVAVLVDDSESAGYVVDDLREEQERENFALNVVGVQQIHTFQDWKNKLIQYQSTADALALGLYHSLVDENSGKVVDPEIVNAWNVSVVSKPSLGFTDFAIEHGYLAGILESGHEQGYLAGSMAREVLEKDVPAGQLPVRINQKGIVFINLKTAEKLGIPISYEIYEAAGVVVR